MGKSILHMSEITVGKKFLVEEFSESRVHRRRSLNKIERLRGAHYIECMPNAGTAAAKLHQVRV